jgi:hypothetical protein
VARHASATVVSVQAQSEAKRSGAHAAARLSCRSAPRPPGWCLRSSSRLSACSSALRSSGALRSCSGDRCQQACGARSVRSAARRSPVHAACAARLQRERKRGQQQGECSQHVDTPVRTSGRADSRRRAHQCRASPRAAIRLTRGLLQHRSAVDVSSLRLQQAPAHRARSACGRVGLISVCAGTSALLRLAHNATLCALCVLAVCICPQAA